MNPWGNIRKSSAGKVRALRTQNAALRAAQPALWLRLLGPLVVNRSLFRLLAVYGAVWSMLVTSGLLFTIETPQALIPLAKDLGEKETIRNLLSYMLGAQATMVGLIFPLALGMVTLIVQRDEGAATNADVTLYYDQSLAYAVGTSGLTLAIALVLALFTPELLVLDAAGRSDVGWSISLAGLIVLGCWLLANLLVTWQFLITSLSFIRPNYRAAARRRFVASRVIPQHLSALLSDYQYLQISEELFPGAAEPMPFVMGGAAEGLGGDRVVCRTLRQPRELVDIRLVPLRLAVRLWAWRCRRAGKGPGSNKYDWMLGLAGPLGRHLRGDVLLCRRAGGVPFCRIERLLLRHAFVFRAPIDRDALSPSDILEELADRVVVQIDRHAVTGFDHALREMREFHQFLLSAYTIVDAQGVATSYAAYGSISAEHSNWVREYRRPFEHAVTILAHEDSFIGSLAHMAVNLIPDRKDNVPPWIVAGLFEFPQYMVHRIGRWLTAQRAPRGTGLRALVPGALPPQISKAYRSVALRIVGANESALQAGARYAKVPDSADEAAAWGVLTRSWPILFKHLEGTAYLIAASHWHEDEIGAELYAESLLRWRETLGDLGENDFVHVLRSDLLSAGLVDCDWQEADELASAMLLHPRFREALPATVFSAIVANLHADIRVVTALVLTGWVGATATIHGANVAAVRLANGIAPREGPAILDLVRTFVRLRISEWSNSESGYVSGLDSLVGRLDSMIDSEKVPGRVYSVETRFRVGSLASDWFALAAALGDAPGLAAVESWLGGLGDDATAAGLGDETLWQLHSWLVRTASAWSEPGSRAMLSESISMLRTSESPEPAGDAFHAVLVAAAAAIEAHRIRRLAAMPIADDAVLELRHAAGTTLRDLVGRVGFFPAARLQFAEGAKGPAILTMTGVDKNLLVAAEVKKTDTNFPDRFAKTLANQAVGYVWKPYFKLRRRRVPVRSLPELFASVAEEGARIAETGARAIVLMPSQGDDWPDRYDVREAMGDAVTTRQNARPARSYLYTYQGVDFHRSGVERPELLSDDLLQDITISAPDPANPVEISSKIEGDPTDVTLVARLAVAAEWRAAEIVVFVRRRKAQRSPE